MLSPKQLLSIREAMASGVAVCLWEGAIRSGKTAASLLAFALQFHTDLPEKGAVVVIGRTRDTAWRNVVAQLQSPALVGTELADEVVGNHGAPTVSILGHRVYVLGASDLKAEFTIRGLTVAMAYVDEVTTIPELFFLQLLGRMSVSGAKLFGTTNPEGPRHWLKAKYLDRLDELTDWRRWHFVMGDNPGLTDTYRESKAREFTGLWKKRFIDGLWVQAEGAIYETWDDDLHVVDDLPDGLSWLTAGVDYGTTNPAAGVRVAVGGDPARIYITDEWAPGKGTEAERSASLIRWLRDHDGVRWPQWVAVDPAAAGFRQQLWTDGLSNVTAGQNSVLPGIRVVASLLAADRLRVHRSCTNLIREIPGYMWDPKATEKGEDAPIKHDDHWCFVAGTRVTTRRGEVPIEDVTTEDQVATRRGWRPVMAADMTAEAAPVFDVHLSDGRTLTGTGNHPVWVEGAGWVRLDTLRYSDKLVAWQPSTSSSSTASSSGATPTPSDQLNSATTFRASQTDSAASDASTKRSGRLRTALTYLLATTFTTSTATRSTTRPRTSSASQPTSTGNTTAACQDPKPNRPTWPLLNRLLRNGTAPRKGEHGIGSTAGTCGRCASPSSMPVNAAAGRTKPCPGVATNGSAPGLVDRLRVALVALTTSRRPANTAATTSRPTDTISSDSADVHVLAVTPGPLAVPVWNLTVADTPEFFAEGVLVHNCDSVRYGIHSSRHLWRQYIPIIVAADDAPGAGEDAAA